MPIGRSTGCWQITVHRPDLYAAAVFRAELAKAGVNVDGATLSGLRPRPTRHPGGPRPYSMPLAKLLVPFLKLSNNMHAEALTKTMGADRWHRAPGRLGLAATGLPDRRRLPMSGVALSDGSG